MQIKDLKPNQGNVNIVLKVIDKGNVRDFDKSGKTGKVCTTTAKDETGSINLTLWNDDVEKVQVGDTVEIKNGFVSEWKGKLQITTGRNGNLEIVSKQDGVVKNFASDENPLSDDSQNIEPELDYSVVKDDSSPESDFKEERI